MPVPGRYHRGIFGADEYVRAFASANTTNFVMAALNTGCCFRFTAPDTRDVWSVWINWATVAAPGTVQVRIETIDATTGKPTGTLYDANASVNVTPAAGWQQCTFASHPTTGLTAGVEFGVVLLTTVGGTTMTLRECIAPIGSTGSYPTVALTAADGTTRTNFAEVVLSVPTCTFGMSDGAEEAFACAPWGNQVANNAFGNAAAGMKFIVPTGVVLLVAGIEIDCLFRTGTPAGDLRARIFTSADAAVAGTTVSVDKDSLTGVNTRRCRLHFPAVVSLAAGTYRIVLDSASSANSSNCWTIKAAQARVAGNCPSGFISTTTPDLTAGPIVWTDTATDCPPLGLILDDVTTAAGGLLRNPGMSGGMVA